MGCRCPTRQVPGLRKNIGWSGAEILRASDAELLSATPQIFPGRVTGGSQAMSAMGIRDTSGLREAVSRRREAASSAASPPAIRSSIVGQSHGRPSASAASRKSIT